MKFPLTISALLFLSYCLCNAKEREKVFVRVDFESQKLGGFSAEAAAKLFGELYWKQINGRAFVLNLDSERGKVLETFYPKGGFATKQSGASFVSKIPAEQEYYLSYKVRFSDDFPFTKGGKLPGLSSKGSAFTGGKLPTKLGGFSARYMWRRQGDLELYLYRPGMEGPKGERIALDFRCKPSTWYTLTQRVRVNDIGESNGIIQVWIDGVQKLHLKDLYLRGEDLGMVDTFLFSTFFGGGSESWAPASDCSIQFDDFIISHDLSQVGVVNEVNK